MLVCDPIKHPQVLTFCRAQHRCKLSLFISVSTYLFPSLHIVKFLHSPDSSVVAVGGESRERVRPFVRNTDLGRLQCGLTLPMNATLQMASGDLHDALIIQMFDRQWFCLALPFTILFFCGAFNTFLFFLISIAKPSTAPWTRVHLHRLACPPTTNLFWVSTTPGTTSHYERLVHHTCRC